MLETLGDRRAVALVVIVLTILGLLLRLWVAWSTNQSLPDAPSRLVGDETGYDGLATELLQGKFFQWPARTPIYPILLAATYLILGHSYATALYMQALVAATTVPLTFLLARRFISTRAALLASTIVALDPALIFQVQRLYSESLYTPLLLLATLGLVRALDAPVVRRFALAGVLLAIANLTRPTAALLPLLVPFLLPRGWTVRDKAGTFLAYVGAMIIVIAPWTFHNYQTYGVFLPLSVSTAVLWQGSPEFYHLMEQKRAQMQVWTEELNPAWNGDHDPFSIEGDKYFNDRALASIRAEPDVYIWYSLQKIFFYWTGHPMVDWPFYAIFSVEAMSPWVSTPRLIGIFAGRLLPLFALAALIVLHRRIRSFAPLLAIGAYFTAVHAITYGEVRHSEPLHPLLAVFIAAAATESVSLYQSYRRRSMQQISNTSNEYTTVNDERPSWAVGPRQILWGHSAVPIPRLLTSRAFYLSVALAWLAFLTARFFPRIPELFQVPTDFVSRASISGGLLTDWTTTIQAGTRLGEFVTPRLIERLWNSGLVETLPVALFMLLSLATGEAFGGRFLQDRRPGLDQFLVRMGLGLGILIYAIFFLSMIGLLNTYTVAILALAWITLIINSGQASIRQIGGLVGAQFTELRCLRHPFTALITFVILTFLVIGLVGALAPETEFDALWYHLSLPKIYVQLGQLVDVPQEFVAQYPMNIEMLYALGFLFRGETFAKLVNFVFGILNALLVYRLSRTVASRRASLLAVAIFLSTPTVLWEMTTASNDLGTAFFVNLSLLALLNWTHSKSRRWLIVSAVALGVALGSKHLAGLAFVSMVVWILLQRDSTRMPTLDTLKHLPKRIHQAVSLQLAHPELSFLAYLRRIYLSLTVEPALQQTKTSQPPIVLGKGRESNHIEGEHHVALARPSLPSLWNAALYAVISLAIASPWYIKSFIVTGNPVFPYLYRWFPTQEWRWDESAQRGGDLFLARFGPGRDPLAVFGVLWDLTIQPWRYDGELGLVFLALVPFALLAVRKAGSSAIFLAWFSISYTALWASPVSSFQMRFLLPLVPALCALVALSVDWLSQHRVRIFSSLSNGLLRFWLLGLLFANLPWLMDFHGQRQIWWENYISLTSHTVPLEVVWGDEKKEDYLRRKIPGYRATQFANRALADDAYILSFFGSLNYHSDLKLVIYYSPLTTKDIYAQRAPDDEALAGKLRESGISHLLIEKKMLKTDAKHWAIFRQSFFDAQLKLIYQDDEALLYELVRPTANVRQ